MDEQSTDRSPVRFLVVSPDAQARHRVRQTVPDVAEVLGAADLESARAHLRSGAPPQALLIDPSATADRLEALLEEAGPAGAGAVTALLTPSPSVAEVVVALRAGAVDVVEGPDDAEGIRRVLHHVAEARAESFATSVAPGEGVGEARRAGCPGRRGDAARPDHGRGRATGRPGSP